LEVKGLPGMNLNQSDKLEISFAAEQLRHEEEVEIYRPELKN